MSNVPPIPPPPYPPYDPRTQWRVYREQQRAAWRAQRDAWKAQQYAWKVNYRVAARPYAPSIVGPLILIAIGIIWLLVYSGAIAGSQFWTWYGRWWPLVLIAAGLALLAEWALDLRRAQPVRRGGGSFVWLVILLVLFGLAASSSKHLGSIGPWNWNSDNGDLFNMFGLPQHESDQPTQSQAIPANASIEIDNSRGDVSVNAGTEPQILVQAHQVAYANSDDEAQKIFDAEKAAVTVSGGAVLVKANANDHGRVNLSVTVPAGARVTVNSTHGDVTATGLNAGLTISASHGDARASGITGPVVAHFGGNKHDFAVHDVNGNVTADGNYGDFTLSGIKGSIAFNGDIFGDTHIEDVTGSVSLRTSVTNIDLASLPGDLTLDSDNLHLNQATGTVRVTTRSKDVDLNQIYGDIYVENRAGTVSIAPAGAYGIDARNGKGDVEITLPPNGAGSVEGHTRNGDIVTEFGLAVTGDQNKTVTGRIGAGGAKIYLSTDNGDLRLKRGPSFPAAPTPQSAAPAPQATPNAKHLKSQKTLPSQPVMQ